MAEDFIACLDTVLPIFALILLGYWAKRLRLLIIPAVTLLPAAALGWRGVELASLIPVFASSTAVNSFTMAQQMGGDAELAGNIVVATSALCAVTLFLWCFLFKTLGWI